MCHMMYYAPGVLVDPDDLRRAAEVNDEGHGWAIAGKARLWHDRDMDAEEMIAEFTELRNKVMPDREAVSHSRLATTGEVTLGQAHPLIVDDGETAVFLNGTLDYPLATGENDTRHLAEAVGQLDLDDPVHSGSIDVMAVRCNAKIAVITMAQRDHAYIYNRSQWIVTPYGALASNADHLGQGKGWDERTDEEGDLYRWRVLQPGQCAGCHLYGCERDCEPRPFDPPAWRNETQRRARMRRP